MDAQDQEFLAKMATTFMESMTSVFSMLTGREFQLSSSDATRVETSGVLALCEGPSVIVKANLRASDVGDYSIDFPGLDQSHFVAGMVSDHFEGIGPPFCGRRRANVLVAVLGQRHGIKFEVSP